NHCEPLGNRRAGANPSGRQNADAAGRSRHRRRKPERPHAALRTRAPRRPSDAGNLLAKRRAADSWTGGSQSRDDSPARELREIARRIAVIIAPRDEVLTIARP